MCPHLPVAVEVVPEGRGAALGPQRDAEVREDGGAALLHLRHVHQQRRDPVTCRGPVNNIYKIHLSSLLFKLK